MVRPMILPGPRTRRASPGWRSSCRDAPVGARGERHVRPIVDEERHARAVEDPFQLARPLDEDAAAGPLVPVLEKGAAAGDRGAGEFGEVAPAVRSGSRRP
jgi:hypothetical protein